MAWATVALGIPENAAATMPNPAPTNRQPHQAATTPVTTSSGIAGHNLISNRMCASSAMRNRCTNPITS